MYDLIIIMMSSTAWKNTVEDAVDHVDDPIGYQFVRLDHRRHATVSWGDAYSPVASHARPQLKDKSNGVIQH